MQQPLRTARILLAAAGVHMAGRLNKRDGLKGKHADFCAIAVYCENQVLSECSKVLQPYCSCGMLANAAMRAFLLHTRLRLWFRIEGIQ